MALDWRRRLFGERLVRPSTDPSDPLELVPVDVLAPDKPLEDNPVVGVYFRVLPDSSKAEDSTRRLVDLYSAVRGRLEVVQVFMPPWVGFRQDEDNESVVRLFRQSYHGVPWYTMPIEDEVKWVSCVFGKF